MMMKLKNQRPGPKGAAEPLKKEKHDVQEDATHED
jgi:hypothetical protein